MLVFALCFLFLSLVFFPGVMIYVIHQYVLSHWCSPTPQVTRSDRLLASSSHETHDINMLSLNCFMTPHLIAMDLWTQDHKVTRLKELVTHFGTFDIIMLQEVFGPMTAHASLLAQWAQQHNYYYVGPNPTQMGKMVDSGLWTLSIYPCTKVHEEVWENGLTWDEAACKGFMHTRIEPPQQEAIHIINVHFQSSYDQDDFIEVRINQLQQVQTYVQQHLQGTKFIMCGDMNFDYKSPEYRHLTQHLPKPWQVFHGKSFLQSGTFDSCGLTKDLQTECTTTYVDHSFLVGLQGKRKEFTVLKDDGTRLSDHDGIAWSIEVAHST